MPLWHHFYIAFPRQKAKGKRQKAKKLKSKNQNAKNLKRKNPA
jgi:hypothetical protein